MTYYQLRAKYKNGFFLYERRSRNKENMECCLMITLKDTIIRFDYKCDVDTYQREYVRQYMADKVIEKAFDMVADGDIKGFVVI
jgi:hypothetical protein